MKFSDLAPGARFEFEGQVYVKEGPVLAREEATGRLRLIPRYARLRPVGEGGGADPAAPGDEAQALLEAFYREALAALDDPPDTGRRRLEEAWRRLCATLSLRS
jgi:hypothetical protein